MFFCEIKGYLIQKHINSKKFDNDEMREIFIANFLIPDDQKFYQTYMSNGKSIKKSAEVLNVPEKVLYKKPPFPVNENVLQKAVIKFAFPVANDRKL